MMLNWIKKFFKHKDTMTFKKFDVLTIAEGEKHPREQFGLQASSESELRGLLAMTGEKILEIRRVYGGDVVRDAKTNPEYLMRPTEIPPEVLTTKNDPIKIDQKHIPVPQKQSNVQQMNDENQSECLQRRVAIKEPAFIRSSKPKFYKIGDIDIKEQDGKIYQKQWVRVPADDFRVVSDSSNKIIPLSGKHIEVRKWVIVDNSEQEESNNDSKPELICG